MSTQYYRFVELSEEDRAQAFYLGAIDKHDRIDMRVMRQDGSWSRSMTVPPAAVRLIGEMFDCLSRGERVSVLSEDREMSAKLAAKVLDLSQGTVYRCMTKGELPFRVVNFHRRTYLRDVLAFKKKLDARRAARAPAPTWRVVADAAKPSEPLSGG
jgi:hypothetical protein